MEGVMEGGDRNNGGCDGSVRIMVEDNGSFEDIGGQKMGENGRFGNNGR